MVTEQQENFFLTLTEQLIVQTDKEKVAWQEKTVGMWKDDCGRVLRKTRDSQLFTGGMK